ncbi:CvpA family protein [Thermogutta sp.]|uniref:CvpA family protein n=1 Tax=Thermogutta sp. TaxID=1962930 RepID=UPI003C7C5E57
MIGGIPIYDLVIGLIILWTTVYGAIRGFAWQVASLSSLVVSAWAAVRWSPTVAPYLSREEPWNRYLAMLLIFIVCSLIIWLLFRYVAQWIQRVRLEGFDRQMGALLGLAKGILLCFVLTFFAITLSEGTKRLVLESHSGPWVAALLPRAVRILPPEVRNSVGETIQKFKEQFSEPPALPPAVP